MKTWLLDEAADVPNVPTAQGDDEWEQDAWENDEAPEWAEEEDWGEEEDDEDGYDEDEGDLDDD